MQESQDNMDSLQRLLKLEIDRAADRLIKVHGKQTFTHAALKMDIAEKKGDDADQVFWMRIAEKVKRELPVTSA